LVLLALVTAYFWLPYLLDGAYMNRSVWEEAVKYNSYGHTWVLPALVRGELYDFGPRAAADRAGRLGLLICLDRWRQVRYRVRVVLALLWLLLYLGRPTWGPLLDLQPFSRDLHFHRLMIAGCTWPAFTDRSGPWPGRWPGWPASGPRAGCCWACLLIGLQLAPTYLERNHLPGAKPALVGGKPAAYAREADDLADMIRHATGAAIGPRLRRDGQQLGA
jgi:hypothetical protein